MKVLVIRGPKIESSLPLETIKDRFFNSAVVSQSLVKKISIFWWTEDKSEVIANLYSCYFWLLYIYDGSEQQFLYLRSKIASIIDVGIKLDLNSNFIYYKNEILSMQYDEYSSPITRLSYFIKKVIKNI